MVVWCLFIKKRKEFHKRRRKRRLVEIAREGEWRKHEMRATFKWSNFDPCTKLNKQESKFDPETFFLAPFLKPFGT